MPKFGNTSKARLATCDKDLQTVFEWVIKYFDCTIIFGERTPEEQFELFKKGREEVNGKWVIKNKSEVVTYKDGYNKKSKHNYSPSQAVDSVPYPIDWSDTRRMDYFAGFVMAIARMLKDKGIIDKEIVWGGDWDNDTQTKDETFIDRPHFQIK